MRLAAAVGAAVLTSLLGAAAVSARPLPPTVTLAVLPSGTSVSQLAAVGGLSPGLLSAGIGGGPALQTYLDISQGNRVFDSFYDSAQLPLRFARGRVVGWSRALARAGAAPAGLVPGLLASALRRAGVSVGAAPGLGLPALVAADRNGRLHRSSRPTSEFEVQLASLGRLRGLVAGLHGADLLIALERPQGSSQALAIGIGGRGFSGDLTSASTRMDGYVLSTDIAPTILARLGIGVPASMSGEPISSQGSLDPGAVVSLGKRLAEIPSRRAPVLGLALAIWLSVLFLAIAATRGRVARTGVRLAGLALVYLPLVLLGAAALEPSRTAETLLVILSAPLLGALTRLGLGGGYRALALASALTVLAYAADVVAGSPLTPLSLLGPNPGLGVRFYGIGNELGALLAVLVLAGTGAALAGNRGRLSAKVSGFAFLAVGLPAALIFAAGPFGADVGSAIAIPLGAVAAAAATLAPSRRTTALVLVVVPICALAVLSLIDLYASTNTHFTRSVLDAASLRQLGEVAERRLRASANSFTRPGLLAFMPVVVAGGGLAIWRRDRLANWLQGFPTMRAGLLGALAATAVGTFVNDSGLLVAELGAAYLLVFIVYAWACDGSRGAPAAPAFVSGPTGAANPGPQRQGIPTGQLDFQKRCRAGDARSPANSVAVKPGPMSGGVDAV